MFYVAQIGFNDVVQIAILYLGVYALIRYVKGTRSAQVLLGFCILVMLLFALTFFFRFDVLARVVYFLLIYLALSLLVVFQQDIRRVLALVGGQRLFLRQDSKPREETRTLPETLSRSLMRLARVKMGALVAIERGISLRGYEDSAVKLDAVVSHDLLVSIFTPPLPLHDGGIIIRDGRIAAAHCLFPLSNQMELAASGMRHRAAVGLSEETDAVILVVSEETGKIAVAHHGRLHRYPDAKVERLLLRWLRKAMPEEAARPQSMSEWVSTRLRRYVKVRDVDEKGDEHANR